MKTLKLYMACVAFALLSPTAKAQEEYMIVEKTDGSKMEIPVADVEKIYFSKEEGGDDEGGGSTITPNFTVDGTEMTIDSDEDATYAKQSVNGYNLEISSFTDYLNGSYMASIDITLDNSIYGYKLESGDVLFDNGTVASKANVLGNTCYAWIWITYHDYETDEYTLSVVDKDVTPPQILFKSGKMTVVKYDEEEGVVSVKFDKLVAEFVDAITRDVDAAITHTLDGMITAKIKK